MDTVQIKTYDGSLESARELIKDFKLEWSECNYDVIDGKIIINKIGILYQAGDCYYLPCEPEEFKVL